MSVPVGVTVVDRAGWGALPPRCQTPLDRAAQRGTALHYTASQADMVPGHHPGCYQRVLGIQAFHQTTRGWCDIAYSYVVCLHGAVFTCRGRGVRTAAQGTTQGNDAYHAVAFLGTDRAGRADVTPVARRALRWAIGWCNAWAGAAEVRPHSFFHPTACPGDELRAWLAAGMPVEAPGGGDGPHGGRALLLTEG